VVAQRSLDQARTDAGVTELNRPGARFRQRCGAGRVSSATFSLSASAARFADWRPRREPSAAANFISVRPCAEPLKSSELAENFNKMAGDIEEYIERLKEAAEENPSFSSARSACSPRPSTKRIPTREVTPAAWQNIR